MEAIPPRIREIASAEGGKLRLPKARSPLRLGSLRKRRKLPQQDVGRSPRNSLDFEHCMPKWSTVWDLVNLIFCNNHIEKVGLCLSLHAIFGPILVPLPLSHFVTHLGTP